MKRTVDRGAHHSYAHPDTVPDRIHALLALLADGTLQVPITTYPFDNVARAHAALRAGTTVGKLVLTTQTARRG